VSSSSSFSCNIYPDVLWLQHIQTLCCFTYTHPHKLHPHKLHTCNTMSTPTPFVPLHPFHDIPNGLPNGPSVFYDTKIPVMGNTSVWSANGRLDQIEERIDQLFSDHNKHVDMADGHEARLGRHKARMDRHKARMDIHRLSIEFLDKLGKVHKDELSSHMDMIEGLGGQQDHVHKQLERIDILEVKLRGKDDELRRMEGQLEELHGKVGEMDELRGRIYLMEGRMQVGFAQRGIGPKSKRGHCGDIMGANRRRSPRQHNSDK